VARRLRSFLRDCEGSVLVEFTLVFPMFMLAAFGTVDVSYMMFEWAQANKAAYIGARTAVVTNPVASGITALTYSTQSTELGLSCFNSADGTVNSTAACPTVNTTCTPAASSGGTCSDGSTFDDTAFGTILGNMQKALPRLQRQDVQVVYKTNGLGFVGQLNGAGTSGALPMNVTVSIQCMTHQFFFLGALMGWVFPNPPAGCPAAPAGPAIPSFSTTLPSEGMSTI